MKIILKDSYIEYKRALKDLNLESLHDRRERLCLKFAKKCLKMENFKKLFPLRKETHDLKKRKTEKFFVKHINTERYFKSTIPAMQRALNDEDLVMRKFLVNINPVIPENIVSSNSISVKIQPLLLLLLLLNFGLGVNMNITVNQASICTIWIGRPFICVSFFLYDKSKIS